MLGILGDLSLFTSNLALFSGADYSGVFISIIITILGNIGFFFLCKNKLDIDIWDWIWSWSKFTIIPYVLGFISPFLWWWTR